MGIGEVNSNSASDNKCDDIYNMFDSADEAPVYFDERYNDLSSRL